MKYYKTDIHLIQYNPETKVYKIRNTIKKENHVLSEEYFNTLGAKQIKKQKFCELMNIYFKDIKHEWEYKGINYKKLDNFESEKIRLCVNYNFDEIPKHEIEGKKYFGNLILVYHWGRVYYFTFSYNGYPQGQLIHPTTFEIVRWAKPKHCAPIFNKKTKKIV